MGDDVRPTRYNYSVMIRTSPFRFEKTKTDG